jgi:hypothetical protein
MSDGNPSHLATFCQRPKSAGEREMHDLGSSDTKTILQELVRLGLNDDIYMNHIHHAHHRISAMLNYNAIRYRADDTNVLLHRKLDWMLRIYRDEWKLPPGRTDVFLALAKAAHLGMH